MQPTPGSDNPEQYDPKTTVSPHNTLSDEKEDIRAFLREYDAEETSKLTKRLTTRSKEMITESEDMINEINSLALVISFVAGIQATIIILSIPSKDTALARTTNTIAFVGLIMDVTGAITALRHTSYLRYLVRKHNTILEFFSEFENDVKFIKSWDRAEKLDEGDLSVDSLPISDIVSRAKEAMKLFFTENERLRKVEVEREHFRELMRFGEVLRFRVRLKLNKQLEPPSTVSTSTNTLFDENANVSDWGILPLTAMFYGSICFLVSTVLLAARDLHRETWITCLVMVLYLLTSPFWSGIYKKSFRKMARLVVVVRDESTTPPA
ncbi:hypothetical protein CPC08DRAFT_526004 [Agrocybe pediades]|nr:hypothetical protein CPC08DRAFT_526004 [Agrocybe pediades]